jgi:hypothetical protein
MTTAVPPTAPPRTAVLTVDGPTATFRGVSETVTPGHAVERFDATELVNVVFDGRKYAGPTIV